MVFQSNVLINTASDRRTKVDQGLEAPTQDMQLREQHCLSAALLIIIIIIIISSSSSSSSSREEYSAEDAT